MPLSKVKMKKRKETDRLNVKPVSNLNYHPVLYALTDPIKRKKLEKICESLGNRRLLDRVFYGAGKHSLDMGTVKDLLEVTT